MNRDESLFQIRETPQWDVLVIGGGATGLGAALDAASRGYRTALVERGDFACATSSRSTKLIHGGVRYLRQGNLTLVRDALHERSHLLANAPALVHPLPFLIPAHSLAEKLYYAAGLKVYDALAGRHGLQPSRLVSRAEAAEMAPTMDGLAGGVLYYDGQFDDARLAIALAQTLAEQGGAPLNYAPVTSLLRRRGRVAGAVIRDLESGADYEIAARVVINATGIFSDALRQLDDPTAPALIAPSQGAHLVLPKSYLPGETAILLPETADGRVLFAIPWQGRTLLGTTDTPRPVAEANPQPLAEEVAFLLEHAREYLGWTIQPNDILSSYAGQRPLVKSAPDQTTAQLSRDHVVTVSSAGLVTILGGKWTTYRKMAEDTVDTALQTAGLPQRECRTASLRLAVAARIREEQGELVHPRLPCRWPEIHRAVQQEMARTLEDVLFRRTRAAILDAKAAAEAAPAIAAAMAGILGRDEAWQSSQVAAHRATTSTPQPRGARSPR